MDCRMNLFCRSLDDTERAALCDRCVKRKLTAGSTLLYEDYALKTNLVLSGALVTNTSFGNGIIFRPVDTPAFFLLTRGLIFPTDSFLVRQVPSQYAYNSLVCLTDCELARFDHDYILSRFKESFSFARSLYLNQNKTAEHASIFSATLRSYDVYESVRNFLEFLVGKGITLSHQQIADITNHNRVSVTKAISRIKKDDPDLWARYAQNED